ncbi:hypothetical protein DP939_39385 [Spongiactinospora rosea]|uniref:Uncharacterized protein n=1 Tax=Spongiactinospora rosea TaxID=2248750 RepID=A0A366LME2_9ACTN|nr:hypothetical protein [Spongiactinospora rosea]RBQ14673.1 hypothetical protein DP939_39385 [Spongiactinospora rosea]
MRFTKTLILSIAGAAAMIVSAAPANATEAIPAHKAQASTAMGVYTSPPYATFADCEYWRGVKESLGWLTNPCEFHPVRMQWFFLYY